MTGSGGTVVVGGSGHAWIGPIGVVPAFYLERWISYRARPSGECRAPSGARMTAGHEDHGILAGLDRCVLVILASAGRRQGVIVVGTLADIARAMGLKPTRRVLRDVKARLLRVAYSVYHPSGAPTCRCPMCPRSGAYQVASHVSICERTGEFEITLSRQFMSEIDNGVPVSLPALAHVRRKPALYELIIVLLTIAHRGIRVLSLADGGEARSMLQLPECKHKTRYSVDQRLAMCLAIWPGFPFYLDRQSDALVCSTGPAEAFQAHIDAAYTAPAAAVPAPSSPPASGPAPSSPPDASSLPASGPAPSSLDLATPPRASLPPVPSSPPASGPAPTSPPAPEPAAPSAPEPAAPSAPEPAAPSTAAPAAPSVPSSPSQPVPDSASPAGQYTGTRALIERLTVRPLSEATPEPQAPPQPPPDLSALLGDPAAMRRFLDPATNPTLMPGLVSMGAGIVESFAAIGTLAGRVFSGALGSSPQPEPDGASRAPPLPSSPPASGAEQVPDSQQNPPGPDPPSADDPSDTS